MPKRENKPAQTPKTTVDKETLPPAKNEWKKMNEPKPKIRNKQVSRTAKKTIPNKRYFLLLIMS